MNVRATPPVTRQAMHSVAGVTGSDAGAETGGSCSPVPMWVATRGSGSGGAVVDVREEAPRNSLVRGQSKHRPVVGSGSLGEKSILCKHRSQSRNNMTRTKERTLLDVGWYCISILLVVERARAKSKHDPKDVETSRSVDGGWELHQVHPT